MIQGNVVDLMDALRRSLTADKSSAEKLSRSGKRSARANRPPKVHGHPWPHFGNDGSMTATRLGIRRTLGHLLRHQLALWMHCHKCRCATKLDVQELVNVHGAEMVLKALSPSCICENCGARWPDIQLQVPSRPKMKAPIASSA